MCSVKKRQGATLRDVTCAVRSVRFVNPCSKDLSVVKSVFSASFPVISDLLFAIVCLRALRGCPS